jgi:hypothetical protein
MLSSFCPRLHYGPWTASKSSDIGRGAVILLATGRGCHYKLFFTPQKPSFLLLTWCLHGRLCSYFLYIWPSWLALHLSALQPEDELPLSSGLCQKTPRMSRFYLSLFSSYSPEGEQPQQPLVSLWMSKAPLFSRGDGCYAADICIFYFGNNIRKERKFGSQTTPASPYVRCFFPKKRGRMMMNKTARCFSVCLTD